MPVDGAEHLMKIYGYNEHEARFLKLVALHSGYFTRKQFAAFYQAAGATQRFTQKALAKQHVRLLKEVGQPYIYHLVSKQIYRSVSDHENNHRRPRYGFAIRQKLMCLDFVLAHQDFYDVIFLPSEFDKIAHCETLGVPIESMPYKTYRSADHTALTRRYFPDKRPVYYHPDKPKHLWFVYADEGVMSTSGWETWLKSYAPLFSMLHRFEVVYLATTERFIYRARAIFDQHFAPRLDLSPSTQVLLSQFRDRQLFEAKNYAELTKDHLERVRPIQAQYADETFSRLYRLWCTGGEKAFLEALGESPRDSFAVEGGFHFKILPDAYEGLTGAIPALETRVQPGVIGE